MSHLANQIVTFLRDIKSTVPAEADDHWWGTVAWVASDSEHPPDVPQSVRTEVLTQLQEPRP